jgi:hypothetical protein
MSAIHKGKPSGKDAERKGAPGRQGDYKRSGWPEDAATQHAATPDAHGRERPAPGETSGRIARQAVKRKDVGKEAAMAVRSVPTRTGSRSGTRPLNLRTRGEGVIDKSPSTGREGQTTRVSSPSTVRQNLKSAGRKPSARRTSPMKKAMRRQSISPGVASEMSRTRGLGDRRRTRAQQQVRSRANKQAGVRR